MTDREKLITELATATGEERDATISYINSLKWINRNPNRSPEAEQTLRQIQDIIAGRSQGGRSEPLALTQKLGDIVERASWEA